ncbi:hypothetical protein F2Q68_00025311 [Brassica cretica]|uniref:Uncharacterized protein n=1 Tax=Brassica cretica TaxID=69181 RepID=A0A8S9IDD5_BRACR|nr:hypothetical protein F2Q68_00025311 [Brassica cretica]
MFEAVCSLIERLPGVAPSIKRSSLGSYADTPFADDINLIEIPRKLSFPTISAYKRRMFRDGDLYKELTKCQCIIMEDFLSQAWSHVKWEEDSAYRIKHSQSHEYRVLRNEKTIKMTNPIISHPKKKDEVSWEISPSTIGKDEGMVISTWPYISNPSISKP